MRRRQPVESTMSMPRNASKAGALILTSWTVGTAPSPGLILTNRAPGSMIAAWLKCHPEMVVPAPISITTTRDARRSQQARADY
jgi:hypothetical protein